MKIKNKGKVHPSPSSSSPSSSSITTPSSSSDPIFATLQLLPAAVLSLASLLPQPDLEVLSYLLARSLLLSSSSPSNSKSSSSTAAAASSSSAAHRSPSFDCDCFDCYTIYWLRWDSSPNRDLIHRVIDAFEDHLSSSSSSSSSSAVVPPVGKTKVGGGRGGGSRGKDRTINREKREPMDMISRESGPDGGNAAVPREKKGDEENNDAAAIDDSTPRSPLPLPLPLPPQSTGVVGGGGDHKGLARKVLPDVLGILNSRLWNLWSPNV